MKCTSQVLGIKATIGRVLADHLGVKCVIIDRVRDDLIAKHFIQSIFQQEGYERINHPAGVSEESDLCVGF